MTHPVESRPAILHRDRIPILRRKSIIHIKRHHVTLQAMYDLFTEVVVGCQIPKHPPASVEVDIGASFLWASVFVILWRWLEDPHCYLPALYGIFLLSDAEDIGTDSTAV